MANSFVIEGRKLANIPDPQRQWLWELYISNIQSLKLGVDEEDMIIRCKSVNIPGVSFEAYEAEYMGLKKLIPIKKNLVRKITTEMEETEDLKIAKTLYAWMNKIMSHDPKDIFVAHTNPQYFLRNMFTKNILIRMYSYDGKTLDKSVVLHNAWPSNVEDATLSYAGNESVKYTIEWSFDYWTLE